VHKKPYLVFATIDPLCGVLRGADLGLAEASVSVLRPAGTSVEEEGEGKEELSPATPV
jgi:hypothetical protein